MSISTTIGGVVKEITAPSATVGGVVRELESVHTVSGGVLKEIFSSSGLKWFVTEENIGNSSFTELSDDGLSLRLHTIYVNGTTPNFISNYINLSAGDTITFDFSMEIGSSGYAKHCNLWVYDDGGNKLKEFGFYSKYTIPTTGKYKLGIYAVAKNGSTYSSATTTVTIKIT